MRNTTYLSAVLMSAALVLPASAVTVQVTVSNHAPSSNGVGLAPFWVGFHNGSFDSYDGGTASSSELELLAEVGDPSALSAVFAANGTLVTTALTQTGTRVQGQTGVLAPGASQVLTFDVTADGANHYFSYASMILPSSDYYVANGNPLAHSLASIINAGSGAIEFNFGQPNTVNDAGTEVNDFNTSAGNGFFPVLQAGNAAAGADENGVNTNVTGVAFSNFLNQPAGFDPGDYDFNASGFPNGLGSVRIEVIPEPSTGVLFLSACGAALLRRRRS